MMATKTMKFLHNFINLPTLEAVTTPEGRMYMTPVGPLPSVTTVLGRHGSDQWLKDWKARVGEEEARKVSTQAATRGTAVHSICENYLMNRDYKKGVMPFNLDTFSRIKPHLDRNIGSIYGIEVPLWSAELKTAGRCDLLAGWNGINSVIDFKTSKRPKDESKILSYFLQATCYSLMAEERTGLRVPQIVIAIAVDHEDAQIFTKDRDQYVPMVKKLFC